MQTGRRIESFAARDNIVTAGGESGEGLIGADGLRSPIRELILRDGSPIPFANAHYRALVDHGAESDAVSLWLYPGGHVVHYPVSAGEKLNVVATIAEAGPSEGWSAPTDGAHVRDFFSAATPLLRNCLLAPQTWTRWQSATRPPAPRWSEASATLIGDAAHPALPYLAQGAAMALEDAAVLASLLTQGTPLADTFKSYEAMRRERTAQVSGASQRLATIYHAKGALRQLRNAALTVMPPSRFLARMSWIYGYTLPQH